MPFPVKYSVKENVDFLIMLRKLSNRITFLCQNNLQKKLLKKSFGNNIKSHVVGMNINEFHDEKSIIQNEEVKKYNVVFHGEPSEAKGVSYFIDLAKILPEFTFFIPSKKALCEKVLNKKITLQNLFFNDVTWETGLKDIIKKTDLVINPSLWSASIEGALLKSIFFSKRTATVSSSFGFEKEISKRINLIRLPLDLHMASLIIKDYLSSKVLSYDADYKNALIKILKNYNKDIFYFVDKNEQVKIVD